MRNPRLAGRYAKSLIDLSSERGELETVYTDMKYLNDLFQQSRELRNLLASPVIPAEKKQSIFTAVTGNNTSKLTQTFLTLVLTKAREAELSQIITAFIQQYKVHKGIQVVKLTTATPVSEEVKQQLVSQIMPNSKSIELQTVVDPSIIGGFVLQSGDQLVDASISADLKDISRQFENNDFVYKIV